MNIAENIKHLRQKKGVTQAQLANALGVSYQAVSKWETNANLPDITLVPDIARFFGVTADALLSDDTEAFASLSEDIPDDDVIRVVQFKGRKMIRVDRTFSPDCPPIEIAFPRNCNNSTQYFKVEVYGHVIADGSINGDVVCHQSIKCAEINGDIRSAGTVDAKEINAQKVVCEKIVGCYELHADRIECEEVKK